MPTIRSLGRRSLLCCAVALALLASGCSFFGHGSGGSSNSKALPPLDLRNSLTADGAQLARDQRVPDDAPRYHVQASVDPASGKVSGVLRADLPVGTDAKRIRFRYFAGLPSFQAKPSIGPATVNGQRREVQRTHSIATVTLPDRHAARVRVKLPFSYALQKTESSGGLLSGLSGDMSPADIGLLSRHENVVNLGHWLPLWIPKGRSHDPKPDGYGDIGNFPPAIFSLDLSVPTGWQVISGGVRVGEEESDGQFTVHTEGYGLRSLVVNVVQGYTSKQRTVGDTTVRVYGAKSASQEMTQVLDTAADSLRILEESFGAYPWRELDVIAAPLGAGVGGMEWSGAVWIESGIFAGRLPGMGGGLEALEGLGGLFGGGDKQGAQGQSGLGGLLGGMSKKLEAARAWTIAHELGHQWWHVIVGNDSVKAPVIDEPLAQYSACLVMRRVKDASTKKVCDSHISIGYAQMRMFGTSDAAALQRSDEFASAKQYSGVIYGKAPYLYLRLEKEYGQDAVISALRDVVSAQAFELTAPEELRQTLAESLGDPSGVKQLWQYWLRETHGDADVGTESAGRGGLGGGLLDDLLGDSGGQKGSDHSPGGMSEQEMQEMLDNLMENLGDSGGSGQSDSDSGQLLDDLLQNT